ncbi:hypothetical protein ACFVRD_45125 [Streptomyces sp. NPDC057908]|uniref:AbiJ-related protein n=1 Tax=Streptomyces sp. NPDC057908 TaxID=3346276 RepID=UPI0036E272EC
MSKDGERAALRRMLGGITASIGDRNTHKTLTETFTVLSMPPTDEGSKCERVERSFAQVPDSDLLQLAERFLQTQDVDAATRIQLQDALWAEASPPEIPMRTRREIARALDLTVLVQHPARFMKMLDRFWVINDDPFSELLSPGQGRSLRSRIERRFIRNPDWSTEELFEALGAFEASDGRFARFIEAAVAGDVLLDESAQRPLAEMINEHLRTTGIELRPTGKWLAARRLRGPDVRQARALRDHGVLYAQ